MLLQTLWAHVKQGGKFRKRIHNNKTKQNKTNNLRGTQISLPGVPDGRTAGLTDAFGSWELGTLPPRRPQENSPRFCTTRAARRSGPPASTASGMTENQVPHQPREATCSETQELHLREFILQGD